jgi:peptidyl-dipeptidase A
MSAGLSQPWQASLNRVAGADKLDAAALRAYFAPLEKWLDEQNAGKPEGW